MRSRIFIVVALGALAQAKMTIEEIEIPEIPKTWTLKDIRSNTKYSDLGENLCFYNLRDFNYMEVEQLNFCYKKVETSYKDAIKHFTSEFECALTEYNQNLKARKKDFSSFDVKIKCILKAVNLCPTAIQNWINDKDKRMLALGGSKNENTLYELYYRIMKCDTDITVDLKKLLQEQNENGVTYYKYFFEIRKNAKKEFGPILKNLTDCLDEIEVNYTK